MARERAETLAKALQIAATTVSKMSDDELGNVELALGKSEIAQVIRELGDRSNKLSNAYKLKRGKRLADETGESKFLTLQAARAWREAFGKVPKGAPNSAFSVVMAEVFEQTGYPPLKEDAIKGVLEDLVGGK